MAEKMTLDTKNPLTNLQIEIEILRRKYRERVKPSDLSCCLWTAFAMEVGNDPDHIRKYTETMLGYMEKFKQETVQ